MRLWTCENCKGRFKRNVVKPAQTLKACYIMGDKGRPPFDKTYNNGILKVTFLYCENCK